MKFNQAHPLEPRKKTDLIVYENGTIHSVLLEGNSLVLFEECYDCFQHNYLKCKI